MEEINKIDKLLAGEIRKYKERRYKLPISGRREIILTDSKNIKRTVRKCKHFMPINLKI